MAKSTDNTYVPPLRLTVSISIELDGPEGILKEVAKGIAEVIEDLA